MDFNNHSLDLSQPHIMGILNVTPDSFFDGGRHLKQNGGLDIDSCLLRAQEMVTAGATFIDVGGESTRPGAEPISLQQELDRVVPVVETIAKHLDVVISVDTSRPQVILESAAVGAGLINDVRALRREGAMEAAASSGLPVCIMHMQGEPGNMQVKPSYQNVIAEVADFLKTRANLCLEAGIGADKIIIDPGFGFGKNDQHNLLLLKHLADLHEDYPVLVGLSRKSMIGRLLNRELNERLPASLALSMIALQNGASILRVHDVGATADVVNLIKIIKEI